jgi:hypothetical protein
VAFLLQYFFIFDYAAHETDFRWIVRAFDDTVPNVDLLAPMLADLEADFDPLTDFVLRGNCIVQGEPHFQGASVTLLSRFAFEQLSNFTYAQWAARNCTLNSRLCYDDIQFGWILEQIGIPIGPLQNTAFLGYSVTKDGAAAMETGNFSALPRCPERLNQNGCRRYFAPVCEIVFHREGTNRLRWRTFSDHRRVLKNLWNAPPQVQFHVGEYLLSYQASMCWKESVDRPRNQRFVHP